jgi:pre-rRNA-processing protein TSR3
MRSSGSTPNRPPRGPLRLFVVLAGEDHPKACTGRRLLRWGRVREVPREDSPFPRPIVLDPYAPTPLSGADRARAKEGGILVIDCSWNRLAERGGFPSPGSENRARAAHRRLPMLIATNPQHYGRLGQLNTVEAFGAAVYVLDERERARELLEGFRGEGDFLEVNRERLEQYRSADSPDGIAAAERALFGRD